MTGQGAEILDLLVDTAQIAAPDSIAAASYRTGAPLSKSIVGVTNLPSPILSRRTMTPRHPPRTMHGRGG